MAPFYVRFRLVKLFPQPGAPSNLVDSGPGTFTFLHRKKLFFMVMELETLKKILLGRFGGRMY
jgi:hypothetical protein